MDAAPTGGVHKTVNGTRVAEDSTHGTRPRPLLPPTLVVLCPKAFLTRSKGFPSPTGESPENAVPSPTEICHWGDRSLRPTLPSIISLAAPPRPNPSPAPAVRVSGARVSERATSAAIAAVAVTRSESLNEPSAPTDVDCTERAQPSRAGVRLWPA